jgi:hypothetical protein
MAIGVQSFLPHLERSLSNIDNFSLNYCLSFMTEEALMGETRKSS